VAQAQLESKLYAPRRRRELVPRARLRERLDRGTEARLTLISAPAGFGKSTLLAEWVDAALARDLAVAWLSLDEGDARATSFWTYAVAALQRAVPGVGGDAIAQLGAPQPPPIESVLAPLLNELDALPGTVALVLDDYHAVDGPEVQPGMAYFLDHLPPRVHLVIATRVDPLLPLARLRARGELLELRAADLRFTPDEAAAYLNQAMHLDLTAADIAALEERTEGWIAALQLAALSLRGRDDVPAFIASFAGDDRYIVDYLVEEVLRRQPERVRTFLLQTSILATLSGGLCDAVTGQDGGGRTLEALERANLFLVPLDDRRRWYRYHHLFGDVLRTHLADERPHEIAALHRRASQWYERSGDRHEAIRHAFAATDLPTAADLVELAAPALLRTRQEGTVLGWLKALPDDLLRERPVLSNAYAGALLQAGGDLAETDTRLRDAERWLQPVGAAPAAGDTPDRRDAPREIAGMRVVDHDGFRRLPGSVAVHRAGLALVRGDVSSAMAHARRAIDLVPREDHLERGAAAALLGLAAWVSGDLEEAHRTFAAGMEDVLRFGYIADSLGSAVALADIRLAQGRLREAVRTYEQALRLAAGQPGPPPRGTADMHVGLSELHLERNDLHAAAQRLLTAQELGDHAELTHNRYRRRVAMARLRQADGDLDGALALLDEAERLYVGGFFPDVRPVAALKARVWLAQGRVSDALAWALQRGLSAGDELSYVREYEHITLARALLARAISERADGATRDAADLLERLLRAADEGGRAGSATEILALLAVAHHALGDIRAALVPLERALTLAEPEGYVSLFVDLGAPMAALLEAAVRRGTAPGYAGQLLAAFAGDRDAAPDATVRAASAPQGLVEPLSERELDVLRLLGGDLDGPDIARQLFVSLNTLRTHTKNIYAKLGVNSRREAVRRAADLDLLPRAYKR
jgi:LuxR family maltose regulon positive regulatory protein